MLKENNPISGVAAAPNEMVSVRVFNYPREVMFKAWSDPAILKNWWGPNGFTNTFHEFDFQPGGIWKFTMHGPNGHDFHNKNVFAEIIEPGRIVFDHIEPIHTFRVVATFDDLNGKTKLVFRMIFESVEECNKVKVYAVDKNEENFDRLEAELASRTV